MMEYYDVSEKFLELKEWYDGYIFGETEIYNPWSVLSYLRHKCVPQPYWINTSSNIINYLLERADSSTMDEIKSLISGNYLEKYVDESLVYGEIDSNMNALFSILLASGYLKYTKKMYINGNLLCSLKIPNREILYAYNLGIYKNLSQDATYKLPELFRRLINGDSEKFKDILEEFLLDVVSYFDLTKRSSESFYHGLVLGLLAAIREKYDLKSNRESGYGRFDIACMPKDKSLSGIILEFKASKRKGDLSRDAASALKQIEKNNYAAIFSENNVQSVWKYGISFFKKNIVVRQK